MTDKTLIRLQLLNEDYTAAVNAAIAQNRFDVVHQLADEYLDAAAEVLVATAA